MSSGCKVCAAWHDGRETGECGHWCHFVDFNVDTEPGRAPAPEVSGRG